MTRKIAGAFMAVVLIIGLAALVTLTIQNDAETMAWQEALPSMARAGEVEVNNTTLYLWEFEFEGKRCLWATVRYARGGLTCWEPKPSDEG